MRACVVSTPNGYGFGNDWQLVVHVDGRPTLNFWVGQDAKVCRRLLGQDPGWVYACAADRAAERPGYTELFDDEKAAIQREELANIILEGFFGDLSSEELENALVNLEPWALAAE